MLVMINQPCPFPTLYLWNRIVQSDTLVHLTTAQFIRRQAKGSNAFVNGYEIMLPDRRFKLTIPTRHVGTQAVSVAEAIIDYGMPWMERHLATIEQNYRKAKYFDEVYLLYRGVIMADSPTLAEFNMLSIQSVMRYLGLAKCVVDDRAVVHRHGEDASTWMLNLVKAVGGNEYLCGRWAIENYLRADQWNAADVALIGQDWVCPTYLQRRDVPFEANLSILDLLFHMGKDSLSFLQ